MDASAISLAVAKAIKAEPAHACRGNGWGEGYQRSRLVEQEIDGSGRCAGFGRTGTPPLAATTVRLNEEFDAAHEAVGGGVAEVVSAAVDEWL